MNDHFEFDYNVVQKLDPSYEKYLHDKNKGPEATYSADGTIEVEISAGIADRITQRALEITTPWNRKDLDGDELDIVDMMSSKDKSDTETDDPFIPGPFDDLDDVPDVRNTIAVSSEASTSESDWVLKKEYENQPLNGAKINPLQLLPPKTVLDRGSIINRTNQIVYRVGMDGHKGLAKTLYRSKFTDASDNNKLRLIHCPYWFDPVHNVMAQMKSGFKSIIYNTKTHRLYIRTFTGSCIKSPRNRYKANLRGIAFNTMSLTMAYESMPAVIYLQFINRLMEIVLKDVPDAYIPYSKHIDAYIRDLQSGNTRSGALDIPNFAYLTCMLVLQHKTGQRIDWLSKDVFFNVSPLLNQDHVSNYLADFDGYLAEGGEKKCFNYRRARLSAIRKCLKQKPGLKSFAKALFGKQYSKFVFTMLLYNMDSQNLARLLASVNDGRMPKNIYHYLVRLLRNVPKGDDASSTLSTIANVMINKHADNADAEKQRLYTCLTTYERLGETPGQRGWMRWKDMYDMAGRLHIRIRPNKFTSLFTIDALHDKLAEIFGRDERIQREYADVEFVPFTHPDKEYGDGFKFVFLDTPEALRLEGTTMHHCVASYADKCINGTSIIFSMRKGDRSYITIELNGLTYQTNQQYTIKDNIIENQDILDMIAEWHTDVVDMHRNDDRDDTNYQVICERKVIEQDKIRREESRKELIAAGVISKNDLKKNHTPDPKTEEDELDDLSTQAAIDFINPTNIARAA